MSPHLASTARTVLQMLLATLALSACSSESWKEEILLADGSKIVANRTMERKGRHEIGQVSTVTTNRFIIDLPGLKDSVVWETKATPDIGYTKLSPIALGVQGSQVFLVTKINACLAYNKWSRPNPPYVVFGHMQGVWKQIPLSELPASISRPNMLISSADQEVKRLGKSFIDAAAVAKANASLDQPEFKAILREKIPDEKLAEAKLCEKLEQYKGKWIRPGDPLAKQWVDSQEKK